ncbi:hypothetical protein [Phenylobacterium sp.]|uniref:hypothetical protein n=1 Tax=Phenylobacterium sp. TaxID=1871053 RepID=UPI002ED9FB7B
MTLLMGIHIAGGMVALVTGAAAVAARKGGALHVRAGQGFVAAMLLLWLTATLLHLRDGKPDSAVGDLFIGYFVITSWLAARRHDGTTGRIEIAACVLILALSAIIAWGAFAGTARPTPVGLGPVFVVAGFCLVAGLLDLNAILRKALTPVQRISRHLWRMCSAFFIATGSFFLGQQDALPEAVRGSPVLVVLAFAPFAILAVFLVRLRFGRRLRSVLEALRA